ncbi:MAG: hypothetical protein QOF30_3403 [Acidimicrobiaceae bacterium]|nr:hypothetical protein [Acidimicrobiaceae bacterium]
MTTDGSSGETVRTADEERAWSPEESLAVIRAQHVEAIRRLSVDPVPILGMWGVAWLCGFGALYLASAEGPGPFLPTWAAGLVLGLLFAAAIAVSVIQGVGRSHGVEGPSRRAAAMYGWSWTLAFAGLFAINLGLIHQGMPTRLAPLLWSGSSLLVVGLLYLAGGIIWSDRVQYGLGVWTLVAGAASVSAGVPANFAVLSLAGGGGFLVAAALGYARAVRARRAQVQL